MKGFSLASLTLHQKLAALAVLLGAVAVLGSPYGEAGSVEINTQELAAMVQGEVDHVTAEELADWIIAGRTDYRLLDLQDEAGFAAYHVPTAEPVAITELADYPLYRNEKIVLYSGGGIHSAQAWFLLKARGFPGVYILLGGLTAWKEDVLFPALPEGATPEQVADFQRREAVATFFGGSPRTAGEGEETLSGEMPELEMPKVEMPAVVPVARPAQKKRKEGC